VISKQF